MISLDAGAEVYWEVVKLPVDGGWRIGKAFEWGQGLPWVGIIITEGQQCALLAEVVQAENW